MTTAQDGSMNTTLRDTSQVVGGTAGFVNTAYTFHTITGKQQVSFEWNVLAQLHNYANAGENCARYAQAHRYGTGGTWGDCIELQDETKNPGPAIALELDMFVQGEDTGCRVALDVVVGDSSADNGGPKGTAIASAAIRVGAYLQHAWAKFRDGIRLKDFLDVGIRLGDDATVAKTPLKMIGKYDTAFDASGAIVGRFFAINSGGGMWVPAVKMGNCVGGVRVTIDGNEYAMGLFAVKP